MQTQVSSMETGTCPEKERARYDMNIFPHSLLFSSDIVAYLELSCVLVSISNRAHRANYHLL